MLGILVKIVAETMGLSEHIVSNYKYLGLNEFRTISVPIEKTEVVHHEEEGHWETVVVKEGYWE